MKWEFLIDFIFLNHFVDVGEGVVDDATNFGVGQGAIHPEILKGTWGDVEDLSYFF